MNDSTFKKAKLIHLAMTTGILVFIIIAFVLNDFAKPNQPIDETLFIINILMLIGIPTGFFIRKKQLDTIQPSDKKEKRHNIILTANIIIWGMAEGTSLASVTFFLISYNYAHMVLAGLCFSVLIAFRPRKEIFR